MELLAEMPLTPKGYCDMLPYKENAALIEAEMPLTPKGYCDRVSAPPY